ncbi:MAG: hypothetical protein WC052_02970 [Patescibacteria group bacterium]
MLRQLLYTFVLLSKGWGRAFKKNVPRQDCWAKTSAKEFIMPEVQRAYWCCYGIQEREQASNSIVCGFCNKETIPLGGVATLVDIDKKEVDYSLHLSKFPQKYKRLFIPSSRGSFY